MTLNLMIVTRDSVHVAADLRLSSGGALISDASPKVLRIEQWGWQAVVTYCGVGRLIRNSKDTSSIIRDWVVARADECSTFKGLLEVLRREGTRWLRSTGYRGGHTFVVGALEGEQSQLAVVSNVDRLHGPRRAAPLPELHIEITRSALQAVAFGSGASSISKLDLRRLEISARNGDDPLQIQRRMAAVIRDCARSPATHHTVSEACYSYSLSPTRGVGQTHGVIRGHFEPLTITHGMDLMAMIRNVVGPHAQIVPVGHGFVGHDVSMTKPDQCDCQPSELVPADQRLAITELIAIGAHAKALSVSNVGLIGGYCSEGDPRPPQACTWSPEGDLQLVEAATPPSRVNGVNDLGDLVGTMMVAGGANRAFVQHGGAFQVLGTLGGMHSMGFAVNAQGTVVGSSWTIPGNDPGDKGETAFIVFRGQPMRSLGGLREGWNSRPVAINRHGVVVGHSWFGRVFPGGPQRAFLWREEAGMFDLGTLGGAGAVPVAINDHGVVVGITSDAEGRNCSFIWTDQDGMRELRPELASTGVSAISATGSVLFNLHTDTGVRSVIVASDGTKKWLQTFVGHETEAGSINDLDVAVGHVRRNQHSHAAVWR